MNAIQYVEISTVPYLYLIATVVYCKARTTMEPILSTARQRLLVRILLLSTLVLFLKFCHLRPAGKK